MAAAVPAGTAEHVSGIGRLKPFTRLKSQGASRTTASAPPGATADAAQV